MPVEVAAMRRTYVILSLAVPLMALATGCTPAPDPFAEAKPNQKRVLVTFPPLYAITHAVAGDDAYVLSLLTGTGPHDYDGAPTDMFMVNKADLLIYNGLTLDDTFVKRMLQTHRNKSLAVLNVGEALDEESDEREKKKLPPLLLANDVKSMLMAKAKSTSTTGTSMASTIRTFGLGPIRRFS